MSDESSLAVFDLNSQTGIRLVLSSIRQSELPASVKNELKDLVLLYTSGGADESVRISLEQKLNSHGLKPVEIKVEKPKENKPQKPQLPFGSSRPLPSFSAPSVSFNPDVKTKPVEIAKKANDFTKNEALNESITTKETSSQSTKAQVMTDLDSKPEVSLKTEVSLKSDKQKKETNDNSSIKTNLSQASQFQKTSPGNPVNINKNQTPKTPDFVDERKLNSISPVSSRNEDTLKSKSTTQAPITSPATSATSPIKTKHLNRIREIKSAVNKKVGNPVNLVDIDNQTGREYMNALLEAMKLLNSDSLELDRAMERLEKAYLAVEKAVSEKSQSDEVMDRNFKPKESQPKVSGFDNSKKSNPSIEEKPVQQSNQNETNNISGFDKADSVIDDVDSPLKKIGLQTHNQNNPIENNPNIDRVTDKPNSFPSQTPLTAVKRVTSLAEETRNLTPEDLPKTKNTSAEAVGNPLYAPEVDAGLEQLLSDWPLFKKSGLFGTGPKGTEHPLFKKIASLQIPILLAGRFEGANQEIRQSITDYMNGWRYEQGIIYQQGETFELYLRRVIKHILDTQKQRRPV